MVATAVLIDGGFFVKRFRYLEPEHPYDATRAAELAFTWSIQHLTEGGRKRDLYRIFFYDCPPLEKRMHYPVSRGSIDFAKSDEALFRTALHEKLRSMRKVALRLGHLSPMVSWAIKPGSLEDVLKAKRKFEELTDDDFVPSIRQKGVDMRIGIDISSLALKRQVDQIVLFSGDADFVPAAKLARREGVDFILDPLWQSVPPNLREHIDGLRSVCARPKKDSSATGLDPVIAAVIAAAEAPAITLHPQGSAEAD